MPPTTLIIPQHGRSDLTIACVESILRHESQPLSLLIVDDGSPDDSAAQIEHFLAGRPSSPAPPASADIKLLRRSHRGLTAAWNEAARHAGTPTLLFLNNDVLATAPFIGSLIKPLVADGPSSSYSPVLVTGARLRRETALPNSVLARLPMKHVLEGWCIALRRRDFEQLGGFDETMRLYWSDTDLQCRLLEANPVRASNIEDRRLQAIDIPLKHLAHQTTRATPTRGTQWNADREAFVRKWSNRGEA